MKRKIESSETETDIERYTSVVERYVFTGFEVVAGLMRDYQVGHCTVKALTLKNGKDGDKINAVVLTTKTNFDLFLHFTAVSFRGARETGSPNDSAEFWNTFRGALRAEIKTFKKLRQHNLSTSSSVILRR